MEGTMQERESGKLQRNESRTSQEAGREQYDDYTEGTRSMTNRSGTALDRQQSDWSGKESGGGWSGYVVPYRYYGPGYRGVGYYTVMYQGAGDEEQEQTESQYGQGGSQLGRGSDWNARGVASAGRSGRGFAGRGPKGYQRSDERLREEVSDRLMADDQIDASDIEVQVRNGEVTLTGTVPDRWSKRSAEDCAEQVMGVRDVMNQIRVQGTSESGSSETGAHTTSRSGSGSDDSPRSAGERSTGVNGRRRTTASSR
jgi:osmotically-inducible protein OsmY